MCEIRKAIEGLESKAKNEKLLSILAESDDSPAMAERVAAYADPGTLAAEAALEALAENQKADPTSMHDV